MGSRTNHLDVGARRIARIYRDELFFRALEQDFKVTTLVGATPIAVRAQIRTALIAPLPLLAYRRFRATLDWALSNLVASPRGPLRPTRDLWTRIDALDEMPRPEPPPRSRRSLLDWGALGQQTAPAWP